MTAVVSFFGVLLSYQRAARTRHRDASVSEATNPMATRTDFDFTLTLVDFLEAQGDALRRPGMREAAGRAMERAAGLVSPAIAFDYFQVGVRTERKAQVGGVLFDLGRHAGLLAQAQEAFLAVMTIGPRLEEESRALQTSGRALDAFLLGEAGVFVVGRLIERCHRIVEQEAASRGWGVSAELAPGQLAGWAIAEQKLLTGLLDVASIGVVVTDAGMLVPQKSASMMVGMGPEYDSNQVCSPCEFCDMGGTCHYSH
jgi:hypothetical protein